MKIISTTTHNQREIINETIKAIKNDGLIIYPTETCYGIGADATNQEAVDKLLEYKSRREGKPISIAVADKKMASKYVVINEVAENIYNNYLPGPITVVSNSKGKTAEGIESEIGTIGIRIPDYELIVQITKTLGKPITSTSANMSYGPRPYSINSLLVHLPQKQKKLIDLIIDAGQLEHNEPSTVVDTTLNNLNIMRKGSINFEKEISDIDPILAAKTEKAKETVKFGSLNMLRFIDTPLKQPLLFLLSGELGAGKTQFTKGIAKQLGIKTIVKSPTFTIINEYDYEKGKHRRGQLIHIDTWRLQDIKELETLKFTNYLKKGSIVSIEWADKFYNPLLKLLKQYNAKVINVKFEYIDENRREIKSYEIE